MQFAFVNGASVHYALIGRRSAPTLAFINSLGTDFRIWDAVARMLGESFSCLLYDKRGHGLSGDAPEPFEMADYARDLAALLDHVGVSRATIVGLSIGGVVAQEFYRLFPDRVVGLALSDTAAKIGTDESWDARIDQVRRGGIESIADSVLERWFTSDFTVRRASELAGVRAMLTRTPRSGYLAACGALKRADLRPAAAAIRAPTLCLVGESDGSTPVALVRETAALIAGARFEIVPGAAHLPNVERPEAFAALVGDFARALG